MSDVDAVFELLDKWRHLPSYQLERRADIFFALYLTDVLRKVLERPYEDVIVPEFPLRLGTIREPTPTERENHSFKADYLLLDKSRPAATLVELKTDGASLNRVQIKYLKEASSVKLARLIEGIRELAANSQARGKYARLTAQLEAAGLIVDGRPTRLAEDMDVDVVFVQPSAIEVQAGEKQSFRVVCFEQFAREVLKNDSPVAQRFARSLREWCTLKAGSTDPRPHSCASCEIGV